MIEIINKEDCAGCNACVQRCPVHCICMVEDEQGFRYPRVDRSLCIDCSLCENVCPVIHRAEPTDPTAVYAAKNPDRDVVMASSSGGAFRALAEQVIRQGGVVFGARYDSQWQVVHDSTDTPEGLSAFQGSKYVQSDVRNTYAETAALLNRGRKVLFSGTPCQITGLNLFLGRRYDNLLTVGVVCHGVASPLIWRKYLDKVISPNNGAMTAIAGISMRDKRLGWKKFGLEISGFIRRDDGNSSSKSPVNAETETLVSEPLDRNLWLRGFLSDIFLRPSCYACPTRAGKAGADILLADFWGIERIKPSLYSSDGVSLVLVYTPAGQGALQSAGLDVTAMRFAHALRYNPAINENARRPQLSDRFWELFPSRGIDAVNDILVAMRPSLRRRLAYRAKDIVRPAYNLMFRLIKR